MTRKARGIPPQAIVDQGKACGFWPINSRKTGANDVSVHRPTRIRRAGILDCLALLEESLDTLPSF